jgi:hypothetical protein
MHFHTVAVVTQRVTVERKGKTAGFEFQAGGTLLFDPEGALRLAIRKSALGTGRIERRRDFLTEMTTVAATRGPSTDGLASRWVEQDGVMRLHHGWQREYHRQQRRPPPAK